MELQQQGLSKICSLPMKNCAGKPRDLALDVSTAWNFRIIYSSWQFCVVQVNIKHST